MQQDARTDHHDARWRRLLTVVVGTTGLLLMALATAWACTSQSHVSSLEPKEAPAGGEVSVSGAEYAPGETVEVRWETDDGPTLATTTVGADGTFAVTVTVPTSAEAGEHLVFAIAPDLYPAAGRGAATLQVRADEPAAEPAPADEGGTTDEGDTAPAEEPATTDGPAPAPAAEAPAATSDPAPADGQPAATAPIAPPAAAGPSTATGGTAADADVAPAPADPAPAALPRALGRDHTASSPPLEEPAPAAPPVAQQAPPAWTGVPADARPQVGLGLGVGLLAVGLVLLFAGFAASVLTTRRHRVPAGDDAG